MAIFDTFFSPAQLHLAANTSWPLVPGGGGAVSWELLAAKVLAGWVAGGPPPPGGWGGGSGAGPPGGGAGIACTEWSDVILQGGKFIYQDVTFLNESFSVNWMFCF